MTLERTLLAVVALLPLVLMSLNARGEEDSAPLPEGVKAVWDLDKAWRETTPTRERVCLNGLWQWQPDQETSQGQPPVGSWGWFKVPGIWPGMTSYIQKDCQTVHEHPKWKGVNLREVASAWYRRELTVPQGWTGRRIALALEHVNSLALVFVDGTKAGSIKFPSGTLDLTSFVQPGKKHALAIQVFSLPLKATIENFGDSSAPKKATAKVGRRGLCGDVFLEGTPAKARVDLVRLEPSYRNGALKIETHLSDLDAAAGYKLVAKIAESGKEVKTLSSEAFKGADAKDGRFSFVQPWKPEKLWDVHTPGHQYEMELTLQDAAGKVLDAWPLQRFGYRELWIDGRDFYLNGTRIYLSSVPLDNPEMGAAWSTYDAAKESMLRLMSFGINYVYTHNYSCEPGTHLAFEEILRAADDVGMLIGLSQPHAGHYVWDQPDSETANGYFGHAEHYVRVAGNHPSVVFYVTTHNATSDSYGMDPEMMGLDYADRIKSSYSAKYRTIGAKAEAIIRKLDPSRIVYHHSSASFGAVHSENFYTNFVPVQEMSDWFETWSQKGVKPIFTCEYGVPFAWDWTMYRGWFPAEGPPNGKRTFGSAVVPWEFCMAEWNAQYFGDRAYRISDKEKTNLRWEAEKFKTGKGWHRWDYPHVVGSNDCPERDEVYGIYFKDNWRAFRTWGMSANSPWENHLLFAKRTGLQAGRKELKTDWENLQRPGYSPDYLDGLYERMDLAYERSDWRPTAGAQALERNNRPLLAYVAGKSSSVTSKDHLFLPGESFEKQLVVINNSRQTVSCDCSWTFALPQAATGGKKVEVPTGNQVRVPLSFALPADLKPGAYTLSAKFAFTTGETQEDAFTIRVLARAPEPKVGAKIALFDPKGETAKLLADLGVKAETVDAKADLGAYEMLIVGKEALKLDGAAPSLARVRDGLKVVVFEQTPEVLEQRLGFRVATYGLRQVFPRVPDHPILSGLQVEDLRDWRGSGTILPPRLPEGSRSREENYGFNYTWCGIQVSRVNRAGNRGTVASALIEKPARGDFLPLTDGGFSLQYSPLLEYREGRGAVWFCQMDVTGRTEADPAAQRLAGNLLAHAASWRPSGQTQQVLYAGAPEGLKHLGASGFGVEPYRGGALQAGQILVLGPGGGKQAAPHKDAIAAGLKAGAGVVAVALDQDELRAVLSAPVETKSAEHIAAFFEAPGAASPFAGCSPADVHSREPRQIPLVTGGAEALGDGVLAAAAAGRAALVQLAPWSYKQDQFNTKRTFRRASCLLTRVLGNLGAQGTTPLSVHFSNPAKSSETRWLGSYYLDTPEAWDHPYRFFRW
ncbi:MAG: hypothetical protein M5U26_26695 [Planctomycetota bacterium]|nr:hypothetical protein [Planctomycetota bacterium]